MNTVNRRKVLQGLGLGVVSAPLWTPPRTPLSATLPLEPPSR